MIALAAAEAGVAIVHERLDAEHMRLTCANGTLDLKTGELGPHRRADLLTKRTPIAFDASAECPRWLEFLHTIMGGNADLIAFLKRAVGYSLTGDVSEQVLFFLHGSGSNGTVATLSPAIRPAFWLSVATFLTWFVVLIIVRVQATRAERELRELREKALDMGVLS